VATNGVPTLVSEMFHKSARLASFSSSDLSDSDLCEFGQDFPWHPLHNSEYFNPLLRHEHAVVQLFVHSHKMNSRSSRGAGPLDVATGTRPSGVCHQPYSVTLPKYNPTISEFDSMYAPRHGSELHTKLVAEIEAALNSVHLV